MQVKKVMMLLAILTGLIGCSGKVRRSQKTWETPAILETNRNLATTPSCEEVLGKCSLAVEKQKIALKEKEDVIKKQDEIIEHVEKEVEEAHKDTNKAIIGGASVSSFLLLLLLL